MTKAILISTILLFKGLQLFSQQSDNDSFNLKQFKACWKLKDMVYVANGGRYGQEEAEKLFVGKIVCFNSNPLHILDDTIVNPRFRIVKEKTQQFTVRNFQVYKDISKWFKISKDSIYVVYMTSGISITNNPTAKIKRTKAYAYEFAYDGDYLFFPLNGSLFRLSKLEISDFRSER
ncbi:hypothetical protein [Taibaiella koreensis]|uniref:hypothetical protein n=1 Tax=Taibaiella koreensis TaxID=1268548 RepID=UPI0013C34401|nr:hypothetical protein [Taibaiella koreensis]